MRRIAIAGAWAFATLLSGCAMEVDGEEYPEDEGLEELEGIGGNLIKGFGFEDERLVHKCDAIYDASQDRIYLCPQFSHGTGWWLYGDAERKCDDEDARGASRVSRPHSTKPVSLCGLRLNDADTAGAMQSFDVDTSQTRKFRLRVYNKIYDRDGDWGPKAIYWEFLGTRGSVLGKGGRSPVGEWWSYNKWYVDMTAPEGTRAVKVRINGGDNEVSHWDDIVFGPILD